MFFAVRCSTPAAIRSATRRRRFPAQLLQQFQNASRLVYLTGNDDVANIEHDAASAQSMRQWCRFNLDIQIIARTGHDVADSSAVQRALHALTAHPPPDAAQLAACRAHLESQLESKLQQVQRLIAGGRLHQARTLLDTIDTRHGGLAAPRSIELAQRINPRP